MDEPVVRTPLGEISPEVVASVKRRIAETEPEDGATVTLDVAAFNSAM